MISLEMLRNDTPRGFEEFVAKLLPKLGYSDVKLTNLAADSGYDVSAKKQGKKVLFECKKYSADNKVGSRDVRIFADACRRMRANRGIFVTTSFFTRTVAAEQKERAINIEFWDGNELLRQVKNSKPIRAYCVQCKKTIKGNYAEFDWTHKLRRTIESPKLKKAINNFQDNLIPKNPRLCARCEYWAICAQCGKELDTRKQSTRTYKEEYYCSDCLILTKKKRKRNYMIILLIAIILGLVGIGVLIYIAITDFFVFLIILVTLVLILMVSTDKRK